MPDGKGTVNNEGQEEDPETEAQKRILSLFIKTIEQNGGKWKAIFGGVCDERAVGKSAIRCRSCCSAGCCYLCAN